MTVTTIPTAGIADDAVGNTKLDLTENYAFTGTVTGAGGGKVLQQQYASMSNSGTSVTSTSYAATNITDTITPSATSSKILIHTMIPLFCRANNSGGNDWFARGYLAIYRGGSSIYENEVIGGSGKTTSSYDYAHVNGYMTHSFTDSPSTTSATTYTIYIKYQKLQGSDGKVEYNGTSTISLIEIGA